MIEEWVEVAPKLYKGDSLTLNARRNEYGFRLLRLLAPLCTVKNTVAGRLERMNSLGPVIEHMRRNFDKPLSRDNLAQIACLSPPQFHSVFKNVIGVPPMQFLRDIRLRHAQHLLFSSSETIVEIAQRCGYGDPFVFSKFFKRSCGCSPKDYRDRMKAQWHLFNVQTVGNEPGEFNCGDTVCRVGNAPAS